MFNDPRDDLTGPVNARPAADEASTAAVLLDGHNDPLAETDPTETDPTETDPTSAPTGRRHEPSNPNVTPTPADPWSDRQIFSTVTASTVAGTIVGLLILRWLWKRHRRRR